MNNLTKHQQEPSDKAKKVIEQYETTYLNADMFDKLNELINRKDKGEPTEKMREFRSKRNNKHELIDFQDIQQLK